MLNIPFTPSFVDNALMSLMRIVRAHDIGTMRDREALAAIKEALVAFRHQYEQTYPQQMRSVVHAMRLKVEKLEGCVL